MKKALSLLLCAAGVLAAIYIGAAVLNNRGLLPQLGSTVFEVGEYGDYYYYNHLTENEKKAYTAVRKQISAFPESIETPSLNGGGLSKVLNALVCDDPLLFMFKTCTLKSVGTKYYFVPEYLFTQSEYEKALAEIERFVSAAEKDAPTGSDYDKELYYHDLIVNSCTYSDSNGENCSNIVGAFIDGTVTCSGYAKAFKLLLDRAKIESILVTGTAYSAADGSESHMWNAVKIDGSWYFVDPTWDDPMLEGSSGDMCRHNFFNVSAEMLSESHMDYSLDFVCESTELFYYNVNGAYFSAFDSDTLVSIARLIASAADEGKTQTDFLFTDTALTEQAVNGLFKKQKIYRALENADLATEVGLVTDSIKYNVDYDANLITLFFEIKD